MAQPHGATSPRHATLDRRRGSRPRHVDLRPFVFMHGPDHPRVAAGRPRRAYAVDEGALVVNSITERRVQGHVGAGVSRPLIGVTTSEVRRAEARPSRCPRATRRSPRWRSAWCTCARSSAPAACRSCCRRSAARRGRRRCVDAARRRLPVRRPGPGPGRLRRRRAHPHLGPVEPRARRLRARGRPPAPTRAASRSSASAAAARRSTSRAAARCTSTCRTSPTARSTTARPRPGGRRRTRCGSTPDSRLADDRRRRRTLEVNSFHHQAVDRLGRGLRAWRGRRTG